MLVSKSLDTDLRRSEKQTLFRFSALYILLAIVLISVFSFIYYELQKDLMLQEKRFTLQEYTKEFLEDLKELHINFDKTQVYPRDDRYESAIFDSSQTKIFSSADIQLQLTKILYLEDGMLYLISIPQSYYLGSMFVVIQMKDDEVWLRQTQQEIILFGFLSLVFMLSVGYVLVRLFLKPMRDALDLLDRFIKDTTHELNTPVSTVVANIEMIDKTTLDGKLLKKINRIDIAAKTISNIYQDLTYITLGNKIISNNEEVDVAKLVSERIEYFTSLARARKINLSFEEIDDATLYIDRSKLSKLLDNLLSNAIKYNKINGSIIVRVFKQKIEVEDSGIGIAQENIAQMKERYTRFNKSSGGFGIGLNIVSEICKEYNLEISIESQEKIGTKVRIQW